MQTYSGVLKGNGKPWHFLFLGGLVAAGAIASQLLPTAFEVLPASYSFTRAIVAGLLVGAGSSVGNGCTSGHGIAGNSRLSPRSLVYTATFFVSGILTTILTGSTAALGIASAAPAFTALAGGELAIGLGLVGGTAAASAALGAALHRNPSNHLLQGVFDAASGLVFGLGLAFSCMTRPSMVVSALAALQPEWNFTLWFVMGGAIAVALPLFQLVVLKRTKALDGSPMDLPKSTAIDGRLLLGGLMFGSGWGLGGFCPGPAIVALAQPQSRVLAFVGAMVVGMSATVMGDRNPPCQQTTSVTTALDPST